MAFWCDEFNGNKLGSEWVPVRHSSGGQYNGVWNREIVDSEIVWTDVSGGTESWGWGEVLFLNVNAPGDIIVEAKVRNQYLGGNSSRIEIGVNHLNASPRPRYGCELFARGDGFRHFYAFNNFNDMDLPARPAQYGQRIECPGLDATGILKIVRKNNYLFFYGNNVFLGGYYYPDTITNVILGAMWHRDYTHTRLYADWIKIWPESVVL